MERVPDRIKSFYRVNNVSHFRYDRPFHKGSKDKENEFKVEELTINPPAPAIGLPFSAVSADCLSLKGRSGRVKEYRNTEELNCFYFNVGNIKGKADGTMMLWPL